MIRGLAALEVCVGHLRAFFMVDYPQTSGGLVARSFYFLTGLQHQAVMIFFVLSGFLVGGSVIRANRRGTWHWSDYLLRRLSRLWIVIVPALVLTLGWDLLGTHLDPAAYRGAYYAELLSGPWRGHSTLTLKNFLGSLAFLQTIVVQPFGSNGPMKTLANEFWYYMLFPLFLQAAQRRETPLARAIAVALIAAICLLLPMNILSYGLMWLLGVVAFLALDHPATSRLVARWPVGVAGLVVLVIALLAARNRLDLPEYFVISAAFAAALPWLARARSPSALYRRIGFGLSEMSYTLYLVHFPLAACLYFVLQAPRQWSFTALSVAGLAGVLAVEMLYAGAIWWLFERNTDRVRAFVERFLPSPTRPDETAVVASVTEGAAVLR